MTRQTEEHLIIIFVIVMGTILLMTAIYRQDPMDYCVSRADHPPCYTWRQLQVDIEDQYLRRGAAHP